MLYTPTVGRYGADSTDGFHGHFHFWGVRYNNFATDPTHWWGSPDRSKVPLGWTLSPALVELGPVILNYIARTKSANDDFVGAPSGLGYIYPSTWAPDKLAEFSALTAQFLTATAAKTKTPYSTVNVIGDPCIGGTYFPGCKGLNTPNMTSLAPLLAQVRASLGLIPAGPPGMLREPLRGYDPPGLILLVAFLPSSHASTRHATPPHHS